MTRGKRKKSLRRIILNLKAIQFACLSAAQENSGYKVVSIDKEAYDYLVEAIEILEEL